MILDIIENMSRYKAINPYIPKVIDYLLALNVNNLPTGRVEIEGENFYANFMKAHGKSFDDAVFETHNRMIDIQIVLDHEENIGWIPRTELPESEYHVSDDYSLYNDVQPTQTIRLIPGYFAIFFPEDGHAPCISQAESYNKVVFKLKA